MRVVLCRAIEGVRDLCSTDLLDQKIQYMYEFVLQQDKR